MNNQRSIVPVRMQTRYTARYFTFVLLEENKSGRKYVPNAIYLYIYI